MVKMSGFIHTVAAFGYNIRYLDVTAKRNARLMWDNTEQTLYYVFHRVLGTGGAQSGLSVFSSKIVCPFSRVGLYIWTDARQ